MAIAFPLLVNLMAHIESGVQWLSGASASAPAKQRHETLAPGPAPDTTASPPPQARQAMRAASHARPVASDRPLMRTWSGPTRTTNLPQRPLRIVRVVEGHCAEQAEAGRMVISGRLADVCTELDRLAAPEAAA